MMVISSVQILPDQGSNHRLKVIQHGKTRLPVQIFEFHELACTRGHDRMHGLSDHLRELVYYVV